MKIFIISLLFSFSISISHAQALQIEWQYCFGGSGGEEGKSLVQTGNGYTLLCASTSHDGDVSKNNGKTDFWLVRTDNSGNILWEKSYGGSEDDFSSKIKTAPDGGYVLFGETSSNDGDVSGNHGGVDYWVVKTDSLGNLEWQKCLGSSRHNFPLDMDLDELGNIYVIGPSLGEDGDITLEYGHYDFWMVKLNINGTIIWDKTLGGSFGDFGQSIQVTNDGGLLVSGVTESIDYDVDCNDELFNYEAWVIKLDSNNIIEWSGCYGGTYSETALEIQPTPEGGYIFIGNANSNDGDVSGYHGVPGTVNSSDIWVVKLDSLGSIEWQRCLGGYINDLPKFIKLTPEGNYLIGGLTNSNDGDVSGNHSLTGKYDQWLVKLDTDGEIVWQQCFGSYLNERINDAIVLSENRYIILGSTGASEPDGDVNCDLQGGGSVWMYEVLDTTVGTTDIETKEARFEVYPNPATDRIKIMLGELSKGDLIYIYNDKGQIVDNIQLQSSKREYEFSVSGLPAGLYVVVLFDNGKIIGKEKVIISR